MKPEILTQLKTVLKLSPAPAWVVSLIEAAEKADTPEEFHGLVNKIVAFAPIGGES